MRLDAGVQFFHLERLGEVVHPADGERLHLVQLLGEGADEDDGDPLERVVGLEVFAHLVAVHLRHVDVEQDQVRGIASGRQQRQLAAGDGADLIPAVLEHAGQHLEIGGGVVHDQDAGGSAGATLRLLRIQWGLPRAEEIEKFLVLEALGQAAQLPGDAGVAGFDLLDPRQQLVQVRRDDGFAHRVDEVSRPARQGLGRELGRLLVGRGRGVLGVEVLHPHVGVDLLEQLELPGTACR